MDAPALLLRRLELADRRLARHPEETREVVRRLSFAPGIGRVVFDATAGTLLVAFDPARASPEEIRERLRRAGVLAGPARSAFERDTHDFLVRLGPVLPKVAAVTLAVARSGRA